MNKKQIMADAFSKLLCIEKIGMGDKEMEQVVLVFMMPSWESEFEFPELL